MNTAKIIQLPQFTDPRGNLSFVEEFIHVPFKIERTYWIYDVPGGEKRLGRAIINACEFVVALSGSFDVILRIGDSEEKFHMSRSYYGLYIPKMTWREIDNFSTNSLALVLTDTSFSKCQYERNLENYLDAKSGI